MPSRTVHISETGMRLDRFLRIHFKGVRVGGKGGRLTVDGEAVTPGVVLRAGQTVAIAGGDGDAARPPGGDGSKAALPPLSDADRAFLAAITLYEDHELIVFDKPSGLAVHPGTKVTRDLDTLLARLAGPDGERPVLVHRLDKDTSGLLVAAKRRDIAARLGRAFAGREVAKLYRAVVSGDPGEGGERRIDMAIVKKATPKGGRMVAAEPGDPDALPAATIMRVVAVAADRSKAIVELKPETGRQHQLRVHMALCGHAILGDPLYGDPASAARLMLHAHRLKLKHPNGRFVEFEAPLPEGFKPDW
ncbi:MAG: RluA family pseudouridine synthase [Ancalomicrobiaceae bacterium]|nr:RluA family pseudouridine synthase [Ancalomicrobiaceae bacterium]